MDSREMLKKVARRQQCMFDDGLFATSVYSRPEIIYSQPGILQGWDCSKEDSAHRGPEAHGLRRL